MSRKAQDQASKLEVSSIRSAKLIERFRTLVGESLSRILDAHGQLPGRMSSWQDKRRRVELMDYLSLFLLGLLNPTAQTVRGLVAASKLRSVQQRVCSQRVSLGSFSEAQSLVDPALLQQVINQLIEQRCHEPQSAVHSPMDGSSGTLSANVRRHLTLVDSSLIEALPRMSWALWRTQGTVQNALRLHLHWRPQEDAALGLSQACLSPGKLCERRALRQMIQPGSLYVADRYYGNDCPLFQQLIDSGCDFVFRVRDSQLKVQVIEQHALSAQDGKAGVLEDVQAHLGARPGQRQPLRLIKVQLPEGQLWLATSLPAELWSAADIALLYRQRWQVELFFRWLKCLLKANQWHWLAESQEGSTLQMHLTLVAALMLFGISGSKPNKRQWELLQFYLMGWATEEDVSTLWGTHAKKRGTKAAAQKS